MAWQTESVSEQPVTGTAPVVGPEPSDMVTGKQVTWAELFFDLVFVVAVTQPTRRCRPGSARRRASAAQPEQFGLGWSTTSGRPKLSRLQYVSGVESGRR